MNRKERREATKQSSSPGAVSGADPLALFQLAWQRFEAGQLAAAKEICDRVLTRAPSDIYHLYLLGLIHGQAGNHDIALDLLGKAVRFNPQVPEFHNAIAETFRQLDRFDDAYRHYRTALVLKPDFPEAHTNLGLALQLDGRFDEAAASLRTALKYRPDYAIAYNNLGNVSRLRGEIAQAIACYREAVRHSPGYGEAYGNLGAALIQQNQLDEAVAALRQALMLNPNFAEPYLQLGMALILQRRPDEAAVALRRALELTPNRAEAHDLLGVALHLTGELDQAVAAWRQAVALDPHLVNALGNLGGALIQRNAVDEAMPLLQRALALNPKSAEVLVNLGAALIEQNRPDDAIVSLRRALAVQSDHAGAHDHLGVAFHRKGDLNQAIAAWQQALALNPNLPNALSNLAAALVQQNKPDEAIALLRRALALNPNSPDALFNLGCALRTKNALGEAIGALQTSLRHRPDFTPARVELIYVQAMACDWSAADQGLAQLRAALQERPRQVDPHILLTQESNAADQLLCAQRWLETPNWQEVMPFRHAPRQPEAKIPIGYLLEDLRESPVTALIAELIERHDRSRFDIAAYCFAGGDGAATNPRLRRAFDRVEELPALDMAAAAQRIRDAGAGILIDLVGHTQSTRAARVLAQRPAPVQVNYLGYPATMGASFVDYVIADPCLVPADQQAFFTERLVHLPSCYQPSDTKRVIAAPPPSRAECGLPREGFVFCSFNNSYKIRPAIFDIWMRVLRQVPGSVLWLIESNAPMVENLCREAAARGVEPDRLVFASRVPMSQYLARLSVADLFLDTLPYNAGATANDALWAGLPLLTCRGDTYVGRMAASVLRAARLPELIAATLAEYEAMALRLATEPALLRDLRQRLVRERATLPLFDIARYTRHLEAAYAQIWETWMRGDAPHAFAVAD